MRKTTVITMIALAALLPGCSSTGQRAAITAAGGAAGAGVGYAVGGKKPAATAIGAVVGAGGTALAQGKDKTAEQEALDAGYLLGDADATKRLFWAKQKLEEGAGGAGTRMTYYTFQGPEETADGRKLVPETIVVPVLEPIDPPSQPTPSPQAQPVVTTTATTNK